MSAQTKFASLGLEVKWAVYESTQSTFILQPTFNYSDTPTLFHEL